MTLVSKEKQKLYAELHKNIPSYGRGPAIYEEISILIDFLKPKTVLDYGCGKGLLIKSLQERYHDIEFFNYDPAIEEYNHIDRSHYDLLLNTDVLEHIPEDSIDDVLKHMNKLSGNIFFNLHHGPAVYKLPNGENAHCTIKPKDWYREKIKNLWGVAQPLISRHFYCSSVVTFDLPIYIINQYTDFVIDKINEERKKNNAKMREDKNNIKILNLELESLKKVQTDQNYSLILKNINELKLKIENYNKDMFLLLDKKKNRIKKIKKLIKHPIKFFSDIGK